MAAHIGSAKYDMYVSGLVIMRVCVCMSYNNPIGHTISPGSAPLGHIIMLRLKMNNYGSHRYRSLAENCLQCDGRVTSLFLVCRTILVMMCVKPL